MRQYSIGRVKEEMGFGLLLDKLQVVKARNYDDAIEKATKKLGLVKGDTLSILALQGQRPEGFCCRYTVTV